MVDTRAATISSRSARWLLASLGRSQPATAAATTAASTPAPARRRVTRRSEGNTGDSLSTSDLLNPYIPKSVSAAFVAVRLGLVSAEMEVDEVRSIPPQFVSVAPACGKQMPQLVAALYRHAHPDSARRPGTVGAAA
jgi:hypothetical protein